MTSLLRACVALSCLFIFGCASQPQTRSDPRDPWERFNRATYAFNDAVDRTVAKPVARTYRKVTPQFVETGVSNFMDNLSYPVVIVNNLFQGKVGSALRDTGRLVLNTTLGVGGLFDPATAAGLDENDEDFGQTLGVWGVPTGPYLVLPFLGPSTVRDGFGSGVDSFAEPLRYVEDDGLRYSVVALRLVDSRARLLDAEAALEGAYDRYVLIRSAYLQRRAYLVSDGEASDEPPEDPLEEDDSFERARQELDEELRREKEAAEAGKPPPQRQ